MRMKAVVVALLCASSVLIFIAPFLASSGTFRDLDGTPGFIDHPLGGGLSGIIYWFGDMLCHQDMGRSLVINGNQMPVCVRDAGIIVGAAICSLVCTRRRCENRMIFPVAIILIAIMGIEWAIETTGFDSPVCRFVTGAMAGIGIIMLMCGFIDSTDPQKRFRGRFTERLSFTRTWSIRRTCRCCNRPGTRAPRRIWGKGS